MNQRYSEDQQQTEQQRLRALHRYTRGQSPELRSLVQLTSAILNLPMTGISLIGREVVTFPATHGIAMTSQLRDEWIAPASADKDGVVVIPDVQADPAAMLPLVQRHGIAFYAGATIRTLDQQPIGVLFGMDINPRTQFGSRAQGILRALAALAMNEMELRRTQQPPMAKEATIDTLAHGSMRNDVRSLVQALEEQERPIFSRAEALLRLNP